MPAFNAAPAGYAPTAYSAEQIMQPVETVMIPSQGGYVTAAPARGGLSSAAVAAFAGAAVGAAAVAVLKSRQGASPVSQKAMKGGFDPLELAMPQQRIAMSAYYGSLESPSARALLETMEGVGPETGNKVWDPLKLAEVGTPATLKWFRHAELKHGRVAMAAMTGLLFHINHIHFPGMLSPTFGVSFESLSAMGPFEAWNAIPLLGQAQILWTIAGLEHASECLNPEGHYMKGGTPGDLKFLKNFWDTPGFTKRLSPEVLAKKRTAELRNGRLAMIGIISVCSATAVPGSVPFLANAPLLTGPGFALPFGTF
jgi:hypothetical protein